MVAGAYVRVSGFGVSACAFFVDNTWWAEKCLDGIPGHKPTRRQYKKDREIAPDVVQPENRCDAGKTKLMPNNYCLTARCNAGMG